MGNRKALLIGPDNYGEGFFPLPAVKHDVELMGSALKASGYEIEICRQDVFSNAAMLDKAMGDFCTIGGPEDIRIVYFTGHGIRGNDNVDSIVPAGTTRADAFASGNQRVSTDLSTRVAASKVGLVLFIIDACRDKEDFPIVKGGAPRPGPQGPEIPDERFVRFFGCAANEVCQILSPTANEPSFSLFTKALADSVSQGNCVSLEELLSHVEKRCSELLTQNLSMQSQKPHLSCGELSEETKKILQRPIFDPVGQAALSTIWDTFDPDKLHCLVVLSEHEHKSAPEWGLKEIVLDAVAGETGDKIWKSFRSGFNLRSLVSGKRRLLPEVFEPSAVSFGFFSVVDAFASKDALDKALRAIAEADLVVFDVTHFEPAAMVFVGIRAACCRSLSICSHGGGWKEGQPLEEMPFNLLDLNINSHTPLETRVGSDPVVERFVRRVEIGFNQVAKHPAYLDLPAYDALRQLGSNYNASSTIDVAERILVLCSYDDTFFRNWQFVRSRLKQVLWTRKRISPEIERIIDYGTPQLIWQSLYEQIRRTAACVVDWSEYSPSVFMELGVRLAISEWGAVQIVDERYLPGREKAKELIQIERMRRLLNPIAYRYPADASGAFERAGEELLRRTPHLDGDADYNRIHRVLLPVIGETQQVQPGLVEELKSAADALHHPDQGRVAAPQILFHGSRNTKRDSEKAALELRIAAWLYLEYRVKISKVKQDVSSRKVYHDLGRSVIDALYDLGDDESFELAGFIEDRLTQVVETAREWQEQAKSYRKKGDALRKAGREDAACDAYEAGVAALKNALKTLPSDPDPVLTMIRPLTREQEADLDELVETYGALGGMLLRQRLPSSLNEALVNYKKGAKLEESFRPGTYNRLNAVKTSLLVGDEHLRDLEPQIRAIAAHIESNMRKNKALSDSGWTWADLGDCFALLGNPDDARKAYATFIAKAEIKSPERTLDVLKEIATKLKESGDPDVMRLQSAIDVLDSRLAEK